MNALDHRDGVLAVEYAREVVATYLDSGDVPDPERESSLLADRRGAFVTLEKNDSLRGCIGRPYPEQTGFQAVRQSAVSAATEDPRFPPVAADELDVIRVEVSLLGPPQTVTVNGDPPTDSIEVGRDGLIVEHDGRSGLLLPQVPMDYDWDRVEFLDQTCRKAGLSTGCWREEEVAVERFTADVFAETTPGGPVDTVDIGDSAMG